MIVTDADGHILWREDKANVCLRADRVLLTEGTKWSESAIGTNAMGTALALGRPVQIHSADISCVRITGGPARRRRWSTRTAVRLSARSM